MSLSFVTDTSRPLAIDFPDYGISAVEAHHGHDFKMGMTQYDYAKIIYVIAGSGWIEGNDEMILLRPDAVAVIPAGAWHCLHDMPRDPMHLYVLSIHASVLPVVTAAGRLPEQPTVYEHGNFPSTIRSMFQQVLYEQDLARPGTGAIVIGHVLHFLGMLCRLTSDNTSDVNYQRSHTVPVLKARVKRYIDELSNTFYYQDDLNSVAHRLGMSRRRFTGLFRTLTGSSWQVYIQKLRLNHAVHLLETTNQRIATVSFECGFSDVSNFHRTFRREYKVSPGQWRQQHMIIPPAAVVSTD